MASLVFDTSAILNFGHRDDLDRLLKRLSGEYKLFATPAVQDELTDPKRKAYYTELLGEYFTVQSSVLSLDIGTLARLSRTIDPAEITVMTLAIELNGTAVLDERAARREARTLGLRITGTLGLMQEGLRKSWLSEADCLNSVATLSARGFAIPRPALNQTFAGYLAAVESFEAASGPFV